MSRLFWVYLITNRENGTLYCGHKENLVRRAFEHRTGCGSACTLQYKLTRLDWCEPLEPRESAKIRVYRIRSWNRALKIKQVEATNPNWDDLFVKLNHSCLAEHK